MQGGRSDWRWAESCEGEDGLRTPGSIHPASVLRAAERATETESIRPSRKPVFEGVTRIAAVAVCISCTFSFVTDPHPDTRSKKPVGGDDLNRRGKGPLRGYRGGVRRKSASVYRRPAIHLIPPTMEQPQDSLLVTERGRKEYARCFAKSVGPTIGSPWRAVYDGKTTPGFPKKLGSDSRKTFLIGSGSSLQQGKNR